MHNARNTLIPTAIALLLSIGVYVYIFDQVVTAGREVKTIEQKIDAEHEKARRRDAVRTTLENTEAERRELESRLLEDSTLVSFFETLEALAEEAGVLLEIGQISESVELDFIAPPATGEEANTKPVSDPASESLEWLGLDIKATGSWSQVYQFLSFVELLPYETRESNIHLRAITTSGGTVTNEEGDVVAMPVSESWELSFTLKVLKLKAQ
jgi:hypothetical protein